MKKWADLTPRQWLGQAAFYAILAAATGYFSDNPSYHHVKAGEAELKLVVRYSGKRLGECRQLGGEELEKLPPNMRAPQICPREKSPVFVEMSVDDDVVYEQTVHPSGLHEDGVIALYERFVFDAGEARLRLRIRDDLREQAYSHVLKRNVELDPSRILVVEFNDEGFQLVQSSGQRQKTG